MAKKIVRNKRRTTEEVKSDILDAVGKVLVKHGYNQLGVEIVAKEAGMDKAMLYRHFENFEGILKAYVEQEDFWLNFLVKHGKSTIKNHVTFFQNMFEAQFKELLKNKELQQLLIWELADKRSMMKDVAKRREHMAGDILQQSKKLLNHADINVNNILAILTAGLYYLALHKDQSTFCEVDLNDSLQQKKFITDLYWLIEQIFNKVNSLSERERIALNCINKDMDTNLIAEITELSTQRVEELRLK